MRTDKRYTRVRDMLLDEAVPRLSSGGIALCHICQRSVYFAGGFLELVLKRLEQTLKRSLAKGVCASCGGRKFYTITRYRRFRCADCKFEWSNTAGTAMHKAKKPHSWYEKIVELSGQGLNPHQIAKRLHSQPRAIYAYLRRREVHATASALPSDQRGER